MRNDVRIRTKSYLEPQTTKRHEEICSHMPFRDTLHKITILINAVNGMKKKTKHLLSFLFVDFVGGN